jgi:elongation factor Ts
MSMTITPAAVKALRDRTNAPMMACKAALTEANGDQEKAIEILRKKNASIVAGKAERETAEGRIAAFIDRDRQVGALVEVRCESAPVAKSDLFTQLANDIARQVARGPGAATVEELVGQPLVDNPAKTVNDRIHEVIGLIRENMKVARLVRLTGTLGSYVHHDGSMGVILQVEGANPDPQVLRDVSMHIAASNPVSARREDVPKTTIEKEMEIARAQAAGTGKPAAVVEKIAEGRMKKWFEENVLIDQPAVTDSSKTIGQMLSAAGLKVVRFVRYKVGEIS